MVVRRIKRKGRDVFVRQVLVAELDIEKCSKKFLSHKLGKYDLVNVKCHEDGELDLRGKKEEYRILMKD